MTLALGWLTPSVGVLARCCRPWLVGICGNEDRYSFSLGSYVSYPFAYSFVRSEILAREVGSEIQGMPALPHPFQGRLRYHLGTCDVLRSEIRD